MLVAQLRKIVWKLVLVLMFAIGLWQLWIVINMIDLSIGILQPSTEEGELRAEPLIAVLDGYHAQSGEYPRRLDEVDLFFTPRASLLHIYEYQICQNRKSYVLYFPANGDSHCFYASQNGTWQCLAIDATVPPFILNEFCQTDPS